MRSPTAVSGSRLAALTTSVATAAIVVAGCSADSSPEDTDVSSADAAEVTAPIKPRSEASSPSQATETQSPRDSEASTDAEASGPADDESLRELMAAFRPVIEGYEHAAVSGAPPYDSVQSFWQGGSPTIEPAACKANHHALELATDVDLTTAARDLVQPDGLYVEPHNLPYSGGEIDGGVVTVLTRIFGDEELASTVALDPLLAECTDYTVHYPEWNFGYSRTVDDVSAVMLPGVQQATTRIDIVDDVTYDIDDSGTISNAQEPVDATAWVHAVGPYAIAVVTTGVDEAEDIAASAITSFVDHFSGGADPNLPSGQDTEADDEPSVLNQLIPQ